MKTFLISGVSAIALAGMALAVPFEDADTDGNGTISLSELQAIDPAASEAEFTLYDVNLDGELDEDEYAAWRVATQGEADPLFDEPVTGDPLIDDPMADEDPVDLEEVPADPYEPSMEKSLLKADEHDEEDEDGKDEYAGDEAHGESDAEYAGGDASYDSDADADEITDELNEEQADDLEETAEEDGDGNDPWK